METLLGAALMVLCLHCGWSSGEDQVEQSPQALRLQEGDNSTLKCTYSVSNFRSLQWYKQDPGEGPELLLILYSVGDEKYKERLRVTLSKKESILHGTDSKPEDSATYFCADGGTGNKLIFGTGTLLSVQPNIRDPAPAVYQLKSSKSNNTICLFTDFDSRSNESTNLLKSDTETFQSDQTTLDMRSMDSKSNGILFWKSRPDFACDNISDKSLFHSSSGIVCDAKLVEKSFETDMHLNFKNLSVIGFRILLLKVAGFNLLMTLRLWSR